MERVWPEYFQPAIVAEGRGLRLSAYTLALEAWRRDLTVSLLDPQPRKLRISDDAGNSMVFLSSRPGLKNNLTVQDKHTANRLLRQAGVPVPESHLLTRGETDARRVEELAAGMGYPVVLKPVDGSRGRGVYANITDAEALARRYGELLAEFPGSDIVLERHVPGRDYRVLVYGETYVAACLRTPANVVGDGAATVRELINAKNAVRARNPFLSSGLIKRDAETLEFLRRVGHDYDSVPAAGEHVQLKGAANASAGGDVVDVTETLPENIRRAAVAAVRAIPELPCAGVDILYDEESGPEAYHVLELNGVPQIGVHMYPSQGAGVDVPAKVIDLYFPSSRRSESRNDRRLAISLDPIVPILAQGLVAEVTIPPIPPGRYAFRRVYEFTTEVELTPAGRRRLHRRALELNIIGFARRELGGVRVMLAGTKREVERFHQSLTRELGKQGTEGKRWIGRVSTGFEIDM